MTIRPLRKCRECENPSLPGRYLCQLHRNESKRKGEVRIVAQMHLRSCCPNPKDMKCSRCGKSGEEQRIELHHPNYDEPLEVVWLCKSCHMEVHSEPKA